MSASNVSLKECWGSWRWHTTGFCMFKITHKQPRHCGQTKQLRCTAAGRPRSWQGDSDSLSLPLPPARHPTRQPWWSPQKWQVYHTLNPLPMRISQFQMLGGVAWKRCNFECLQVVAFSIGIWTSWNVCYLFCFCACNSSKHHKYQFLLLWRDKLCRTTAKNHGSALLK